jgi:hypothetical protein
MIVDELETGKFDSTSSHTAFKQFFHFGFAIGMFAINPIIGGAYLGFSGVCGGLVGSQKEVRRASTNVATGYDNSTWVTLE